MQAYCYMLSLQLQPSFECKDKVQSSIIATEPYNKITGAFLHNLRSPFFVCVDNTFTRYRQTLIVTQTQAIYTVHVHVFITK